MPRELMATNHVWNIELNHMIIYIFLYMQLSKKNSELEGPEAALIMKRSICVIMINKEMIPHIKCGKY